MAGKMLFGEVVAAAGRLMAGAAGGAVASRLSGIHPYRDPTPDEIAAQKPPPAARSSATDPEIARINRDISTIAQRAGVSEASLRRDPMWMNIIVNHPIDRPIASDAAPLEGAPFTVSSREDEIRAIENIDNVMLDSEGNIRDEWIGDSLQNDPMVDRVLNAPDDTDDLGSNITEAALDFGAASETTVTRPMFVRMLQRNRVTASRIQRVAARIYERYGNTQEARATIRKWLVQRILPTAAGAAAYVYRQNASLFGTDGQSTPSVDRGRKGGIAEVDEREIDEAAGEAEEYYESGQMYKDNTRAPGVSSRSFMDKFNAIDGNPRPPPLLGSVGGTASPDAPLGPTDSLFPKSSPLVPPSNLPRGSGLPGAGIFTARLDGDSLSERVGTPAAAVKRTTIPVPPAINYIAPSQYYAGTERRYVAERTAPVATHAQSLKRKADTITTHQDRNMEAQVPQTYDSTQIPSMPASVNANTSVQWKEYAAPYTGYNVPLTDTPNVVGIGFDAATSERELAEKSMGQEGKEVSQPAPAPVPGKEVAPLVPAPGKEVNPANATNPALRNVDKAKPAMGGEHPQA